MLRKLLIGAGMAYMANKFMGRRRGTRGDYARTGMASPFGFGRSRWNRSAASW